MRRALFAFLLLIPSALVADGMIVIPRPVPNVPHPFPLSVTYHRVTVDIRDGLAKTSVDQEFVNPTSSRLEGEYIFPLPKGAVISNFAMEIDGKMTTAELLDAAKARRIYEDIVRSMRDPALLEYIGKGAFKVRIFPIEPRSRKKIRLSYSEVVRQDGGLHAYTYPLNTEKFSQQPLEEVAIRVNLESSLGLKTIFCPTHEVEIRRKGNRTAVVGFEEKHTRPDEDFLLYYSTDDKQIGVSVLTHKPSGEDGYFLLSITPSYDAGSRPQPKDVTFVFDTSGSMSGRKMDQARRALRFGLGTLQPGDRFEVIRFSTEAEALFGDLVAANAANVAKAQAFADGLEPIGGTNSEEALKLAIDTNRRGSMSRPKIVVFMTDGKPTIGETDEERLVKRVTDGGVERMRVFTFGVGDDLNTHFLDKLTERTRAARTYVGEKEDLELPLSTFFEKIKSPVLVDPALEYGGGMRAYQTYPRHLPDVFKGSPLVVFGRYSGTGTAVTLKGTVDGKLVSIPYYVQFPSHTEENDAIAPLWAAQRIGYLLDQIRLNGEEKELVDEATRLARRFGIITPYTSYLVVEDERRHVARENQVMLQSPVAPRLKGEYDAMQSKAGAPSVQASREVEAMKNAQNTHQMNQGSSRMTWTDASGKTQNLADQARNVQGRAVYNVNGQWVDSKLRTSTQKVQRVKFASPEYWALLDKEPESREFLALGRNVRFALRAQVIEVHE
jgi:Ca-activated chloride channel homolog